MNTKKRRNEKKIEMPGAEEVQRELASATSSVTGWATEQKVRISG